MDKTHELDTINILTWNICWGCMAADETSKNDVTAAKLAIECKNKKKSNGPLCIDYVSQFLQINDYDIIALQESKNWKCIYMRLSERYNYVNFVSVAPWDPTVTVDITTFFKKDKYSFMGGYFGNILEGDVRPYQFMKFMNNKRQPFYFLNIHNGHLISNETLNTTIMRNEFYIPKQKNKTNTDISQLSNNDWIRNKANFTPRPKPKEDLPIIAAGDFNDHGKYNYWKNLKINDNILFSSEKPPTTCCTPVKEKYTWLGAPSIIFDPNVRKQILGIDIKFIFDITTFSSTACVGANGKRGENLDYNLCKTNESLNDLCYEDKYKSHAAFSGRSYEKFLTDIEVVKDKILEEQHAIEDVEPEEPYQRYNEVLAYFFPWEIFGVEVGGREPKVAIEMIQQINHEKQILITEYETLFGNNDRLSYLLSIISDASEISNLRIEKGEYLLVKFLKFLKCSTPQIQINIDVLKEKLTLIIEKLKEHLYLYEYGRKPSEKYFSLFKLTEQPLRSTDFELFKQEADEKFFTHIKKYAKPFNSTLNKSDKLVFEEFNYTDFMKHNQFPLFARCALLNPNGEVNIKDCVDEIFKGRLDREWAPNGKLNLVINPATIILPNANVIITSQIFDRVFEINELLGQPRTYKEYVESLIIPNRSDSFNNDIKIGDYILHNNKFIEIQPNHIPSDFNKNELSSDHLPVEVTLQMNEADNSVYSAPISMSAKNSLENDVDNLIAQEENKIVEVRSGGYSNNNKTQRHYKLNNTKKYKTKKKQKKLKRNQNRTKKRKQKITKKK